MGRLLLISSIIKHILCKTLGLSALLSIHLLQQLWAQLQRVQHMHRCVTLVHMQVSCVQHVALAPCPGSNLCGGGKESLVPTVRACVTFSRIFWKYYFLRRRLCNEKPIQQILLYTGYMADIHTSVVICF